MMPWSTKEVRILISFIMLDTDGKSWVTHRDALFWTKASVCVQQQAFLPYKPSGKCTFYTVCVIFFIYATSGLPCRSKCMRSLINKLESLAVAELYYLSFMAQQEPAIPILSFKPPHLPPLPINVTPRPLQTTITEGIEYCRHGIKPPDF